MTVTVIVGVFFRYVLRNPLGWTEELARYLMIWSALLAVSVAVRYREHVGISLLMERLPLTVARTLAILTKLVILGFLVVLTARGWDMAVRGKMQLSMSLNTSMFWPLLAVPVTGALTAAQVALQALVDLKLGSIAEIMGTAHYE
jgi:TRAP-type C4-dicarboxylate transport system permease small subunit